MSVYSQLDWNVLEERLEAGDTDQPSIRILAPPQLELFIHCKLYRTLYDAEECEKSAFPIPANAFLFTDADETVCRALLERPE